MSGTVADNVFRASGVVQAAAAGGAFESALLHMTVGPLAYTTTTSWTDFDLTTVVTNEITGASLSSGEITLPAGTYYCDSTSQYWMSDETNFRLYDDTGSAVLLYGDGGYAHTNDYQSKDCRIVGRFTLGVTSVAQVEYYTAVGGTQTLGQLGAPNHWLIWKLS